MNFTKGEWKFRKVEDDDFSYEVAVSIKDRDCIACVYRLHKKTEEECEANAKLIAAAPDLLEALQFALDALKNPMDHDVTKADIELIESAIKKATN